MKLSEKQWSGLMVAIVVIIILFFPLFRNIFFSNSSSIKSDELDFSMAEVKLSTRGVVIKDVLVGSGDEALAGMVVTVHYVGRLKDGTIFDSSIYRGVPFSFVLGTGQVIRGWDVGIFGMRVGGRRELVISPEAAYGERGYRNPETGGYIIPPKEELSFEVELLSVDPVQPQTQ